MARFIPLCQGSDLSLSLLLVSSNANHLRNVTKGLHQIGSAHDEDFLKVYSCESVSQALRVSNIPQADFAVFCVNENHSNAVTEVEQNILKLDHKFMSNRVCLVCDSVRTSSSDTAKVLHLRYKYQLHVLWEDLETKAPQVCQRIVTLASTVCGVVTGFPLVTHRPFHQVSNQEDHLSSAAIEESMT